MSECPYCRRDQIKTRRNPISSGLQRRSVRFSSIYWCAHPKHSPVDNDMARSLGGVKKLDCLGELDKCPLGPEKILDT